ncbi:MAG TPA: SDR family NAD(P)-dependent oxidoreductase [Solirubrobacter sp.]|jgi:short-subunit dehydrogenase|nr:SDR family NAD(P)-dependent oxidoreductase [Solirubrobacter sp.]
MTETTRPLAVVTGASSGIGLELARQFADNGFDLIVAADGDGIHPTAHELEADPAQVDLSTREGVDELHARLRHRPVAVLALNAGITARSDDLERELALIDLNVRSTVHLARLVTRDMAARGRGRVLFTASMVESMPGPNQAAYNASKAFIQSFATGLRHELREHGVSVTVLAPETPGVAEDAAREAFQAVMAGREETAASPPPGNASRFLPDGVKARLSDLITRPR